MLFKKLIAFLLYFLTLSSSVKIPTLCLNECLLMDLGLSKKSINNQNTLNTICQNKSYKNIVMTCLVNTCETPGLKTYNTNEFVNLCSKSHTKDATKNTQLLVEKDIKTVNQRQFVLSKRLSFSGGEKNSRNRENLPNL